MCIHCFWNHSIDESFLSVGFPSYSLFWFDFMWFVAHVVFMRVHCLCEKYCCCMKILALKKLLGDLSVFSGTRIIIPFGLQIPHCLYWNLYFISLFDSLICEDRVPNSVSMTGEYFWPFDICLLCKEEIKVEKDSAWSLPAGPDVWIQNDVSHFFFPVILRHFLAFECFWYCRSTWLDFTKAGLVKLFLCTEHGKLSIHHLYLIYC